MVQRMQSVVPRTRPTFSYSMVLTLPEKRLCLFSLILLKAATTKQVETQIHVSAKQEHCH